METYQIKFGEWLEIKGLSSRSIKEYLAYLNKLKLYESLNQEAVNEFLLKYNQQVSRAFLKNYLQFLNENKNEFQLSQESVDKLRELNIPKITGRRKRKIPQYLNKLQVNALVNEMKTERDKLMVLITFYGGLRLSGLLNIKPLDFIWSEWNRDNSRPLKLKITEKGDRDRFVFIPSEVAQRLKTWIKQVALLKDKNPNNPLFQIRVGKRISSRYWETLIEKASINGLGEKITPHVLRHSCATYLLEQGWNIKEVQTYLGHENISTTEIYLHIDNNKLMDKFESSVVI